MMMIMIVDLSTSKGQSQILCMVDKRWAMTMAVLSTSVGKSDNKGERWNIMHNGQTMINRYRYPSYK